VLKAKWSGKSYAEFPTGVGVLAIFSAEAQEKYIPWLDGSSEEQERNLGIQGRRRRSRVSQTTQPGERLGKTTLDAALEDPFRLLP
jgi:hypothetical protein